MNGGPAARYAARGLGAAFVVLAIKGSAWWLTDSVSLLADALETVVNVAGAGAALLAIRVALQPPDDEHPWGHDKAEYFSAGFEGGLVAMAGGWIAVQATAKLFEPSAPSALELGLGLSALAAVVNGALSAFLIRRGRELDSMALIADGRHLRADVYTSIGAIVGLLLAKASGWWRLDPLIAIAIGGHVIWEGLRIVREAVDGLMDVALSDRERSELEDVIAQHLGAASEAHGLLARRAGRRVFAQFHLVVAGTMAVEASHQLCDELEEALHARWPAGRFIIHVEPESEARRHEPEEVILPR